MREHLHWTVIVIFIKFRFWSISSSNNFLTYSILICWFIVQVRNTVFKQVWTRKYFFLKCAPVHLCAFLVLKFKKLSTNENEWFGPVILRKLSTTEVVGSTRGPRASPRLPVPRLAPIEKVLAQKLTRPGVRARSHSAPLLGCARWLREVLALFEEPVWRVGMSGCTWNDQYEAYLSAVLLFASPSSTTEL